MKLSEYFENAKGIGVLATTDLAGQVNQAIYAKPLFSGEGRRRHLFLRHGQPSDP